MSNSTESTQDTSEVTAEAYDPGKLLRGFIGHEVKVFLCTGIVLSGELTELEDNTIRVVKAPSGGYTTGKESWINLDHAISVTKES